MRFSEVIRSEPLRSRVRVYGRLARWNRPLDLLLLLWIVLSATWLASAGDPDGAALAALLIALFLLRSAVWVWLGRSEVAAPHRPEVQRLALGLALTGLCFALPLGWPLLLLPTAVASLAAALLFQRRTYLAQTGFALAFAGLIPAAYTAQTAVPDRVGWLLFLGVLFWGTALVLLAGLPRRTKDAGEGRLTLPMLFGRFAPQAVAGFQLAALLSLYLLGRQGELEVFFRLGLLTAAALTAYQQFVLFRRPEREGWRLAIQAHVWWGVAIFCGMAFHYLCACP